MLRSLILTCILASCLANCPTGSDCIDDGPCIKDGWCDEVCNTKQDNWDGGDCCRDSCQPDLTYDCSIEPRQCRDPRYATLMVTYSQPNHLSRPFYSLKMDCSARSASLFWYSVGNDRRNFERAKVNFWLDESSDFPETCQPSSGKSYKHPLCPRGRGTSASDRDPEYCYDKGHLAMADHLDASAESMYSSFARVNMIPQLSKLNQAGGIWRTLEDIVECQRDHADVAKITIVGGLIFNDTSNDHFLDSHGQKTPDWFWRVHIIEKTDEVIVDAWLFPHSIEVARDSPDKHRTTVESIRAEFGDILREVPDAYTTTTTSYHHLSGRTGLTPQCDDPRRTASESWVSYKPRISEDWKHKFSTIIPQ